jgi:hypothetical protein
MTVLSALSILFALCAIGLSAWTIHINRRTRRILRELELLRRSRR